MMTGMNWIRLGCALSALAGTVHGNIDPAARFVWAENLGWVNLAPTHGGMAVHFDGERGWLAGYAWAENAGWIRFGVAGGGPYANTSASDFGVNLDAVGNLSGFAWGENIGWIRFDPAHGGVAIDPANGAFGGFAWGENVGWIRFDGSAASPGVRTEAFDLQSLGTPNWWLALHGVSESFEGGNGIPAWQEFVMDSDPNDPDSYLRVVEVQRQDGVVDVTFRPASPRRAYVLQRRGSLTAGEWLNVPGQIDSGSSGNTRILRDPSPADETFYRVVVTVEP
jgi:hypothetical protein